MFNPITIANYFILLSIEEGIPITPMKLQKLIYFAHGFYLAKIDKPLINETVQAWKYGPVIDSIYHRFKGFGNSSIPHPAPNYFISSEPILTPEIKGFLKQVWDLLKGFTAVQLSNLTHVHESPWDIVIKENGAIITHSLPINNDLIKNYFVVEYGG